MSTAHRAPLLAWLWIAPLGYGAGTGPLSPWAGGTSQAPLELGRVHWLELEPGTVGAPSRDLSVTAQHDGELTATVVSYDFDAALELVSAGGDVLGRAEDGLFEENPRLVVPAAAGQAVHLRVTAPAGSSGKFAVRVANGAEPPPAGLELRIARTDYLSQSLDRALERGEHRAAADFGLRLGEVLHGSGRYAEAADALRAALGRYETAELPLEAARARMQLGRSHHALGRHAEAREHYERALEQFLALDAAEDEGRTRLNLGELAALAGDHEQAFARFAEARAIAAEIGSAGLAAQALRRAGGLHRERGELDLAEPPIAEQLRLARELGDPAGEARALSEQALLRADQGRRAEALELLQEQLAVVRALGDGEAEAVLLGALGKTYAEMKRLEHALEHFERALSLARGLELPALVVTALHNLGTFYEDVQDFAHATEAYREAQALARTLGLEDEVVQLDLQLASCAILEQDLAQIAARLPDLEHVLARARADGQATTQFRVLRILTRAERLLGRPELALEHLVATEELRDRVGWDELELLLERGWIQLELGEVAGAQRSFEELHARIVGQRAGLEDERLAVAEMQVLEGLGRLAKDRGDYLSARDHYLRRVELATRFGSYGVEGTARRDLGAMCLELGDDDEALKHVEKALAIAEERDDREELFGAHYELGRILVERGDLVLAREHFATARGSAPSAAADVLALAAQANAALLARELDASLAQHEEALTRARAIGFDALVPDLLANLSEVHLERGEHELARSSADEALREAATSPAHQPLYTLPAVHTLTVLDVGAGRTSEARARIDAACELLDQLRLGAIKGGLDPSDGQSTEWFARFDRLLQDCVRAEAGSGAAPDLLADGFRRADWTRSRSLLAGIVELGRGARSQEAADRRAELESDIAAWEAVVEARRAALRAGEPASRTQPLAEQAGALRAHIDQLERALARISPRDAAVVGGAGVDPTAVANTLDARTALVLYAEGRVDLYAYLLRAGELTFVDLGPRAPIDAAVAGWVSAIGDVAALGGPRFLARHGRELQRMLLAPIVERAGPGTFDRLLIVPTPALATLPFESLVVDAASDPASCADLVFALDRWSIGYAPSASVLERLAERGPRRRDENVLLLADPLYPAGGRAEDARTGSDEVLAVRRGMPAPERLGRLASTRDEAFALAEPLVARKAPEQMGELERLRGERSGTFEAAGLRLLFGQDASRAKLFGSPLRGFAWIHLAAHGHVDRQSPEHSGVALAANDASSYDGFLTIADVLGLELDANLVVLSGCETAQGDVQEGEGVESMATAFLYSGARGVVASLWQVDDRATAEIMQAFYGDLLGEARDASGPPSPSDALTAAKRVVRARVSAARDTLPREPLADPGHPFYWASFVHLGSR